MKTKSNKGYGTDADSLKAAKVHAFALKRRRRAKGKGVLVVPIANQPWVSSVLVLFLPQFVDVASARMKARLVFIIQAMVIMSWNNESSISEEKLFNWRGKS
ncbi:hypothetical protein Droror1_Dr00009340 [Drosera rotundifolia]